MPTQDRGVDLDTMDGVLNLLPVELHPLFKRVETLWDNSTSIWVQLPQECWTASGGDNASGRIGTLAYLTGTIAVKTLDDVQDEQVVPQESNGGMALSFHALNILALLSSDLGHNRLQQSYINTILTMCAGQQLDLGSFNDLTAGLLDHSWDIARKKTATWFSWGAAMYPRYSGDENSISILEQFGMHLGLMHQLANDFRGFQDLSEKGDLKNRKLSLPVAYTLTMLPQSPYAQEFSGFWSHVDSDQDARQQIVNIAQRCGVEKYCVTMSAFHAQQARETIYSSYPTLATLIDHPNLALTTT